MFDETLVLEERRVVDDGAEVWPVDEGAAAVFGSLKLGTFGSSGRSGRGILEVVLFFLSEMR